MNTSLLNQIEKPYLKKTPSFRVGDTVAVNTIVREGNKKRTQVFKGIIIAIKGSGLRKSFTVRKISYGVGVEKIFPLHSPNIEKIEVLKRGKVKRSKIYYMRKRIGKQAMKIAEGVFTEAEIAAMQPQEKAEVEVAGESNEESAEETTETAEETKA